MFTGIIETIARVEKIEKKDANIHFFLSCVHAHELKIDQSVAHNGCCLTVVSNTNNRYEVVAIYETLKKTNLGFWEIGSKVNFERCLKLNDRIDGHLVQGHVDCIGKILAIENKNGSFWLTIGYDTPDFHTVSQGSITVNGISLTVAESNDYSFSVAIIPYTWENTNLSFLSLGDFVNLEFDLIGKYLAKLYLKNNAQR